MITSNSMPMPVAGDDPSRALETPELIDRLAVEMRAIGDRDLPHSFYVEQVKRKLAGSKSRTDPVAANDQAAEPPKAKIAATTSSVFQCWAMPE
jgi:hypothetical protein